MVMLRLCLIITKWDLSKYTYDIQFHSHINNFLNSKITIFRELLSQIEIFKQNNKSRITEASNEPVISAAETSKEGSLKYQMIYVPDKSKVQDLARISQLEKRLGYLEGVVGISNDSSTKCSQVYWMESLSLYQAFTE